MARLAFGPGVGRHTTVAVVGCGGTGGFVAEGLCRLLPPEAEVVLVDPDVVEPHNLRRQNFYPGEVGEFKARALALRLGARFNRTMGYVTQPYTAGLQGRLAGQRYCREIVVGCVDNALARKELAAGMSAHGHYAWWLDAGNGLESGQVFMGNAGKDALKGAFAGEDVQRLPLPTVQEPGLLVPAPDEAPRLDCAQAVDRGDQSPVINQMMATLVLQFVSRMLAGTLTWMSAYVDLSTGNLTPVEATPEAVAKLTGITTYDLTHSETKRRTR